MSLERIKKYCERLSKIAKILLILVTVIIAAETVCFMWQALMPGKLNGFFNVFRIYAPFTSNIDNNALSLYELGSSLFNNLFLFLLLNVSHKMFLSLAQTVSLSSVTHEIKQLALLLAVESITVPVMKVICYAVFIKLPITGSIIDLLPLTIGGILYFIAVIIQSKAVLKENRE